MTLTREVLKGEVASAKEILAKWENKLDNIPKLDVPGSDADLVSFLQDLIGELTLVSGKCDTLANILNSNS